MPNNAYDLKLKVIHLSYNIANVNIKYIIVNMKWEYSH